MLSVAFSLRVVCCISLMHVARRVVSVAHLPVVPCTLACRLWHAVRWIVYCCMPSGVCCTVSGGALHVVSCVSSAARCPLDRACCTFSVACCLISVSCPSVPCCMVCAVCRPSHVASRLLRVVCGIAVRCCMLHTARPQSHAVSCPLPAPSCMSSVVRCTGDSQRRRARSASLRTDGNSQSRTVTLATPMHARTHARTHTSVCAAAGLAGHRGAQLRAPPQVFACEGSRRNAETVAACLRS